jgi:hypothetical protein
MAGKAKHKAEYGDFQTPITLARAVCARVADYAPEPVALLEPTCGSGTFLSAALDRFKGVGEAVGVDINAGHLQIAENTLRQWQDACRIKLLQADFFVTYWDRVVAELPEPILVLGNPPWVTNSHLGALQSRNVPIKSNFHKHRGLDAITGKANFDISEWMLIRLLEAMNGRYGVLAMLCKASTARKTLYYAWKNGLALERSAIYGIDADLYFDAAVDAVLLVTEFRPGSARREAEVYGRLTATDEPKIVGYEDGVMLADIAAYHRWKHLCGDETLRWRSGIKHDCAKVMELYREGDKYRNGLGQVIEMESAYVYPMMKSSSLAKGGQKTRHRCMLVPQKTAGEPTNQIEQQAPRTWDYLKSHAVALSRRASSIYRGRPAFAIFGVGDYTFAPWKVAISGFYKKLAFVPIGPLDGKPVVFDDTSYFLPCENHRQAVFLAALLNSNVAQSFYSAFLFWDSKRPVTAEVLRRLDLRRLASELGRADEFTACFEKTDSRATDVIARHCKRGRAQLELWHN